MRETWHLCHTAHASNPSQIYSYLMPRQKTFNRSSKGFKGIPRQQLVAFTQETDVVESAEEHPVPLVTASHKKMAISATQSFHKHFPGALKLPSTTDDSEPEEYEFVGEREGYRIVNLQCLSQAVCKAGVCSDCGSSLTLQENLYLLEEV